MNLKTTKIVCCILLGVVCLLAVIMLFTQNAVWGYIMIAVILVFGVVDISFWRCPACKKCIGWLGAKHCPNCGEKIES